MLNNVNVNAYFKMFSFSRMNDQIKAFMIRHNVQIRCSENNANTDQDNMKLYSPNIDTVPIMHSVYNAKEKSQFLP